ncbi:hypothetical protein ACQQ2N_18850 [Dokdonella sp. MW10]|uniref:hypothetical protein n=1 Tax=Dokdonella sp. MW10 TaxID=2992926 RepID=UPI003F7CFD82
MRQVFGWVVVAFLVVHGTIAGAQGMDPVVEKRLKALEARVLELEKRLEEKAAAPVAATPAVAPVAPVAPAVPGTPAPPAAVAPVAAPAAVAPVAPAMPSAAAWDELRIGMGKSQVTRVLGKAGKRRVGTMSEVWYYPDLDGGSVEFDRDGRVAGWTTPE